MKIEVTPCVYKIVDDKGKVIDKIGQEGRKSCFFVSETSLINYIKKNNLQSKIENNGILRKRQSDSNH